MKATIKEVARDLDKINFKLRSGIQMGVRKVAVHAFKKLITETPKGYTGQTRKSWSLTNYGGQKRAGFTISNSSRVMKYLEDGTKAHGPKKAKFLFIPLNRKTAMGGLNKSSKFGKDYVLTKKVKGIKGIHIVRKRSRIVDRQVKSMVGKILNSL